MNNWNKSPSNREPAEIGVHMQLLLVVNLTAFLLVALLFLVLLTPKDGRRPGSNVSRLYPGSDSHRPAAFTKQ
jgi:hypothetical protein